MSLSEFEIKRVKKFVGGFIEKKRPPVEIRNNFDLGYTIQNQSVEIFEIRPAWRDPKEKIESPVAKATYVKKQKIWKVFWQSADLNWHNYKPNPQVKFIEQFLELVEQDENGCFWG